MKVSRSIAIGAGVLVLLIALAGAQFIFRFTYQDLIYSNFWIFVFSLIAIAILSIVGAVFIGMYWSHRYFSARGFTPFEEEMLKMRKEVSEIREKLHELHEKNKKDK